VRLQGHSRNRNSSPFVPDPGCKPQFRSTAIGNWPTCLLGEHALRHLSVFLSFCEINPAGEPHQPIMILHMPQRRWWADLKLQLLIRTAVRLLVLEDRGSIYPQLVQRLLSCDALQQIQFNGGDDTV
jgi:hypothetical protein